MNLIETCHTCTSNCTHFGATYNHFYKSYINFKKEKWQKNARHKSNTIEHFTTLLVYMAIYPLPKAVGEIKMLLSVVNFV